MQSDLVFANTSPAHIRSPLCVLAFGRRRHRPDVGAMYHARGMRIAHIGATQYRPNVGAMYHTRGMRVAHIGA